MRFILHSDPAEGDDSCFSALRAYRLALQELGSVELVQHPETEADPIFERCAAQGEPAVLLSFAPPHRIPIGLECPTVPIITMGTASRCNKEVDGRSPGDWRPALAKLGRAITPSTSTAQVIAAAMGPQFRVQAIPPPITINAPGPWVYSQPNPATVDIESMTARVIVDSRTTRLSADLLVPRLRPLELRTVSQPKAARPVASERDHNRPVPVAPLEPDTEGIGGIVYTSVFSGPVNEDNLTELLTSFCWAFRKTEDATLVLVVTRREVTAAWNAVVGTLAQLSPFKCRVIALHGLVGEPGCDTLMQATTYYASASNCEPVNTAAVSFSGCGRPAIMPALPSAADHLEDAIGLVLPTKLDLGAWRQDPENPASSMSSRLNWESMLEVFRRSYQLAKNSPEEYSALAASIRQRVREQHSISAIAKELQGFLEQSGNS